MPCEHVRKQGLPGPRDAAHLETAGFGAGRQLCITSRECDETPSGTRYKRYGRLQCFHSVSMDTSESWWSINGIPGPKFEHTVLFSTVSTPTDYLETGEFCGHSERWRGLTRLFWRVCAAPTSPLMRSGARLASVHHQAAWWW